MKITWKAKPGLVPLIGRYVEPGQVIDVCDVHAKLLVENGMAEQPKKPKREDSKS